MDNLFHRDGYRVGESFDWFSSSVPDTRLGSLRLFSGGWVFTTNMPGRRGSSKYHTTWEKAVPAWARKGGR